MLRRVYWQLATFWESLSLLSSTVKQSAGPVKMRPVANRWSALRNNSEDRRPYLHRVGSLKSLQVLILALLAGGFPYYPYRSRTGIVLDDTEYKPMGVTNRPIITAPVPGHVGDIFDVTVSAIQGPGGAHTGQPFVYPGESFISSKCPKINFSGHLLHLSWNSWVQPSPSSTPFFLSQLDICSPITTMVFIPPHRWMVFLSCFNGSILVHTPFRYSEAEIDTFSEALCSLCVLGLHSKAKKNATTS